MASRRGADDLIQQRRVSVNGAIVNTLGTKVDPFVDKIMIDGQVIDLQGVSKTVLALNKPADVVSTMVDDRGRPCIRDYVDETWGRVFHVGRLDQESSGLLILTNDGDLAFRLAHPKHEIQKTYVVDVLTSDIDLFRKQVLQGVALPDGFSKADRCELLTSSSRAAEPKRLLWQLHDGKNRVIRRVAETLGAKVARLHRVAVGNYLMQSLTSGGIVRLSDIEISQLTQNASDTLIETVLDESAYT